MIQQMHRAWEVIARAGVATGLLALALAGCTTTPAYPPAPGNLAGVDYSYHIGASDTVNVIVWRNPEWSMSVPVRPDGKITTPLIDDLPAWGKTPTELARDIPDRHACRQEAGIVEQRAQRRLAHGERNDAG